MQITPAIKFFHRCLHLPSQVPFFFVSGAKILFMPKEYALSSPCAYKEKREEISSLFLSVRLIGLEPTRITTPDPKSGASTNFATSAIVF